MANIFTRTGDQGTTSLQSGERVSKTDCRIKYLGLLDELSSRIGLFLAHVEAANASFLVTETETLTVAQQLLFCMSVENDNANLYPLPAQTDVENLERQIVAIDDETGGLFKGFVLPGGHVLAAEAHVLRCLCRRTETVMYETLSQWHTLNTRYGQSETFAYINRLSDYLYAVAKKVNHFTNTDEKNAVLKSVFK